MSQTSRSQSPGGYYHNSGVSSITEMMSTWILSWASPCDGGDGNIAQALETTTEWIQDSFHAALSLPSYSLKGETDSEPNSLSRRPRLTRGSQQSEGGREASEGRRGCMHSVILRDE